MRINYGSQPNTADPGQLWSALLRLAMFITAALALLAITLIGMFIVLPLLLFGGIALHFYLRYQTRQSQRRSADSVIDAEYTVIDHR